jgi:hypothetical protein
MGRRSINDGVDVFVFICTEWCFGVKCSFLGEIMFVKFMDKLASYRPFLDVVLLAFFWVLLAVATWTKDYENMAIAAWWIILLELVQVNDNLKSLKDNW